MSITHIEMAAKTQEKFEFYMLTLVFTLLALSIQTAKFGNSSYSNFFELFGWGSLLVSGLAGLWRMEFIPVQHGKLAKKHEIEEQIIHFEEIKRKGGSEVSVLLTESTEKIDETLENNRKALIILDTVIDKIDHHNLLKYKTHKYAFVIGLLFILLSRGYAPVTKIGTTLLQTLKLYFSQ